MKQTAINWTFRAVSAALAVASPLAVRAAGSASIPAQAASPYTYVGRLMDAEHVGFDADRVAEISAYDASGKLVATSKTFYQPNSSRNYALRIPMASKMVDGALTTNSTVRIEVTEPNGTVWTGLVSDRDATLGVPGSVKEVNMVLAECTNEYGIDDYLLDELFWAWCYSAYYKTGETFDPRKDYDGDGMSTLNEVLSGTDPFDPNDSLSILSFRRGGLGSAEKDVLSFTCRPGRAYRLEVSESLENPNWKDKPFYKDESGTLVNVISVPSIGSGEDAPTVYLLPEVGKNAFFRIKAE